MDEERLVTNKYGITVHDNDIPWFDMVEDTRMCINPNIDHVFEIVKKIHENEGRCPSKYHIPTIELHDKQILGQDTRCPCPDFLCYGKCECELFVPIPIVPEEDMIKMLKEERTRNKK